MRIPIKGTIIPNDCKGAYDWFGIQNVCPADIDSAIAQAEEGEELIFEINSGGGAIFAGSEIYTKIREHPGKKKCEIVGFAGSAASFIACAAECSIAPTAMIMIHNVISCAYGDWQVMEHERDALKECSRAIAKAYTLKTGMDEAEILQLMDAETWINADRAVELGFADEIIPASSGLYNAFCEILTNEQIARAREEMSGKAAEEEMLNILGMEVIK